MLRAPIRAGIRFHRDSRFGLYHARRSTTIGGVPPSVRLYAATIAPIYPAAAPAVDELRPSRITCSGAVDPAASLDSKSLGILNTSNASPRSMTLPISDAER